LRNRYYSPQLQRFISEDPIGLSGGINRYGYVDGNPISEIDPLGLMGYGGGGSAGHPHPTQPYVCPTVPPAPPGVQLSLNLEIAHDYSIYNPGAFLAYAQLEWHSGLWDYRTNFGQQYDDFGNFNFGATAAAMGATYYETQNAAGIYDHSGKSEGIPFFKWPYGDDVDGAKQVQAGYDYVKHHCDDCGK
jgi:hypothetical protein